MTAYRTILMREGDNVAVAARAIPAGAMTDRGFQALSDTPQAHKLALCDLRAGDAVVRYGVTIGYALADIPRGAWVTEHLLGMPDAPDLNEPWTPPAPVALPEAPISTFLGYRVPNRASAGTRNILAIHTTVQCVVPVVRRAEERIRAELLPRFPNVDDVWVVNHPYGCGVAIDAPEAKVPIRTLRNLVHHPNFGGEVMCVALGCEKLTVERLLDPADRAPDNVLVLQDLNGFEAMADAILAMAERKLARLNERRRERLPLSMLTVGMQCGGSDALSGVTANPAAGYAADLLVSAGATVLFSEVTEVRDGAYLLKRRCADADTAARLVAEMRWYDAYLSAGGVDRSANTTPGNKQGGLANIVEKAMGSITKSGTATIAEVLSPGELPTRRGLIYAATPASDIVCGPCQLASGIGVQVFMTGRGTPYGLSAAPVLKVCSRRELRDRWPDLIDIDAGPIAEGERTVAQMGEEMFRRIVAVASGETRPAAERLRLHNDFCLFNPAPIT